MKFSEHGHFQLKTDGNIIYIRVTGCWNKEGSVTCIAELVKCFERLKNASNIMMIIDTVDFEGGIEGVYPLWGAAIPLWLESGMTHFIRIDEPESINYQIFVKKMDDILQTKFALSFAGNFSEAIKQAHAFGFAGFNNE